MYMIRFAMVAAVLSAASLSAGCIGDQLGTRRFTCENPGGSCGQGCTCIAAPAGAGYTGWCQCPGVEPPLTDDPGQDIGSDLGQDIGSDLGQDIVVDTCNGATCAVISGYTATCNAQDHCEYANVDTTGWKQWDVWVHVPAGSFTMGSPSTESSRSTDEDPNHTVTFASAYLIGKYEVTVLQYEACQADSPGTCTPPSTQDWAGTQGTNTSANGRSTHPQNGLTWAQAGAVCTWLFGRLPSEAEWEYAATGPTHRKYPWGGTPAPTCANNTAVFNEAGTTAGYGCSSGGTLAVGSKTAGVSWSGALDMSGNVWEWVEDWYHSNYTGAPTDGSAWVDTGDGRVIRGGSFLIVASFLRSSNRYTGTPDYRYAYFGARCLRPIP